MEHTLFSSDTLLERWKAPTNFAWSFWRQIEHSLLVLKNGSCEHTTNDLPTFLSQKRNLEIGPSERLLPVFGTKNRILKNGSCERALTLFDMGGGAWWPAKMFLTTVPKRVRGGSWNLVTFNINIEKLIFGSLGYPALPWQRVCQGVLEIFWSYRSICFLITKF